MSNHMEIIIVSVKSDMVKYFSILAYKKSIRVHILNQLSWGTIKFQKSKYEKLVLQYSSTIPLKKSFSIAFEI